MSNKFNLLSRVCGLSDSELAQVLGIELSQLKGFQDGHHEASSKLLQELANLAHHIEDTANLILDSVIEQAEDKEVVAINLGVARNDEEARELGWPTRGIQHAVMARVLAGGMSIGWDVNLGSIEDAAVWVRQPDENDPIRLFDEEYGDHPAMRTIH